MPLGRDEIPIVAAHYRTAATHYKQIAKILEKADTDITFWDEAGEPFSAAQITHLKGLLTDEKTAGDAAIAAAEAEIAD